MRISDWSSDVCSSDLEDTPFTPPLPPVVQRLVRTIRARRITPPQPVAVDEDDPAQHPPIINPRLAMALGKVRLQTRHLLIRRSEEHTSELQSLMRISYAVFCLKKKTQHYSKSTTQT